MKITRWITLSIVILCSIQLSGQDRISKDSLYYSYELVYSRVNAPGDTIYSVYLVLDSMDMAVFETVSMSGKELAREVPISSGDLVSNSKVEKKDHTYKIYMQEWSLHDKWMVLMQGSDGTKVQLRDYRKESIQHPTVITLKPETADVKIYEGEDIIEEEESRSKIID